MVFSLFLFICLAFVTLCCKFLALLLFIIDMYLYTNYICICMFHSGYSVLLCCSVYCLCIMCILLLPSGVNTIAVIKYIVSYLIYIQTIHKQVSILSNFYVCIT